MKPRFIIGGLAMTMAVLSLLTFGRFYDAEKAMQKQAAHAALLSTLKVASK
jgi:hypothetical protein